MNKKGEPMSLGAVVTIIILVIVLVFVALALSGSFGNLGDYNPFGSGSTVEAVINGCNIACSSGAQDDYCRVARDVRFEKGAEKAKVTCLYMENSGRLKVLGRAQEEARDRFFPQAGFQFANLATCDTINRNTCVETTFNVMNSPAVLAANAEYSGVQVPSAGQQQAGEPTVPTDTLVG